MSIDDLRDWAGDLTVEANNVDRRAAKAVGRTVEAVYQLARNTAPVRTGVLKANIEREHKDLEGEVWNDSVAAIFQETGTSRHAPQPSITIHEEMAIRRLATELNREAWNP